MILQNIKTATILIVRVGVNIIGLISPKNGGRA